MKDTNYAQELLRQVTGKTIHTMTLWAEANQRVLGELIELGAGTTKEGFRLYSELSRRALEAIHEGQASALRWQATWGETPADPGTYYERALAETLGGVQQAIHRVEENAQMVSGTAGRVQANVEQAGKRIHETLTATATKLKELYASN